MEEHFAGVLVLPHTSGPLQRVRGGATTTKPHPKDSGSFWRRQSVGDPFLAALNVARSKVNVPVSVQIEMSEKYLARARKRLVVANEELEKAVEKKTVAQLRTSVPTPMHHEPVAVAALQSRINVDPRMQCAQVRSSACGRPSGHVAREWSRRREHVAQFRGIFSRRARCAAGTIGPATFSVNVDIDRSRRFSCERTLQPSQRCVFSQSGCVSFRRVVVGHDTGGQRGNHIRFDAKAKRIQHFSVLQTCVAPRPPRVGGGSCPQSGCTFCKSFAVWGLAAGEDEDNRWAMPIFLLLRRVWSTLGDSDSDEVVNSAKPAQVRMLVLSIHLAIIELRAISATLV